MKSILDKCQKFNFDIHLDLFNNDYDTIIISDNLDTIETIKKSVNRSDDIVYLKDIDGTYISTKELIFANENK